VEGEAELCADGGGDVCGAAAPDPPQLPTAAITAMITAAARIESRVRVMAAPDLARDQAFPGTFARVSG
jgi:hypothetical protein